MSTPTLIATAGAVDSNSYLDVAGGDTYHDSHLYGSSWFAASTQQKTVGLIWATRLLDQHFTWFGSIASQTQALRWPRAAAFDNDGRLLAQDEIPIAVMNATAELARWLIETDRTSSESQSGAIQYLTVGQIAIKYATATAVLQTVIPEAVRVMLTHLGTYSSSGSGGGEVTMRRA